MTPPVPNNTRTTRALLLEGQGDGVLGGEGRVHGGDARQPLAGVLLAVAALLLHPVEAPGDPRVHLAQQLRQAVVLLREHGRLGPHRPAVLHLLEHSKRDTSAELHITFTLHEEVV